MEIYIYTYEGLLEDKITIKSIGVWWYLSYETGAAPPVRLVKFSPDHFAKLYCKETM